MTPSASRGHWSSRIGFLLACAGSAIGLGNIWKFPYVAGVNGGGAFVLVYLICIVLVGMPIMICEFAIGRATQRSPVEAFRALAKKNSAWQVVGWMGVLAGFVILSYYSVVAGWAMHYVVLALQSFGGLTEADAIGKLFGQLYASPSLNLFWHQIFMVLTIGIVLGGVKGGIEKAAKIMMPVLFGMLILLLIRSIFMPGFAEAFSFVFAPDFSKLTRAAVLEAFGQAFFTLSLGMGAMLTYGSYLSRSTDIVKSAAIVSFMDTMVALVAALIMFPIIFSFGMDPQSGPGLVFKSLPIVFVQMQGGIPLAVIFFLLLVFAALSSAISLLEVVAAFFIDTLGWDRIRATLIPGVLIFIFGVPSALAGSDNAGMSLLGGRNVFDTMDYLASNWMLPLGGLCISLFVGYRMDPKLVQNEFKEGSVWGHLFPVWITLVRYVAPVAVAAVFLHNLGLL
jgi:NSS family neurotransmitter:Na+ symporter